jgi:hypothetical protein
MLVKLNKKSNEPKTIEKIKALNNVIAGTIDGIPEEEARPSNCASFCGNRCGECGNDAAMYSGNKVYR